jgi:hypothetical protein
VIAGREVTLPPGMIAGPTLRGQGETRTVWAFHYQPLPVGDELSSLWIDDGWRVVRSDILPADVEAFQPLLDIVAQAE